MLKVIDEQEHYLLISDGQRCLPSSKGALGNFNRCAQGSDTG